VGYRAAASPLSTSLHYGFKLHLVINERGEILAFTLTAGNVNDQLENQSQIEHSRHQRLAIPRISMYNT
jgi:hypothetical protein